MTKRKSFNPSLCFSKSFRKTSALSLQKIFSRFNKNANAKKICNENSIMNFSFAVFRRFFRFPQISLFRIGCK